MAMSSCLDSLDQAHHSVTISRTLTRRILLVRTSPADYHAQLFSSHVYLTLQSVPPGRAHHPTWNLCQPALRRATRMTAVATPPARGNLVRWLNGRSRAGELGVVSEVLNDGRAMRVRIDSGEEHTFVWPNDRLERVIFVPGQQVRALSVREDGVVA